MYPICISCSSCQYIWVSILSLQGFRSFDIFDENSIFTIEASDFEMDSSFFQKALLKCIFDRLHIQGVPFENDQKLMDG